MSAAKWVTVSRTQPCPSCGKPDWCTVSADGTKRICQRKAPTGVPFQECHATKGGGAFYVFDADARGTGDQPLPGRGERVPVADVAIRDKAYNTIIMTLGSERLSSEHTAQLLKRGFTQAEIDRNGYFTFPTDVGVRQACVAAVKPILGVVAAERVPGFYREGDNPTIYLRRLDGLAVPVKDVDGLTQGLRIRTVRAGEKTYLWFTSPDTPGTVGSSPGAVCHVPLHDPALRTGEVRLTEGELKADIATARTKILTISVPGASMWGLAIDPVRKLNATVVRLAYDRDSLTNLAVAEALQGSAAAFAIEGLEVRVETWDPKWKGIDDALMATSGGSGVIETHVGADAWDTIAATVTAAGGTPDPGILARARIEKLKPRIEADHMVALSADAIEAAAALRVDASKIEFTRFADWVKKHKVPTRPWTTAVKDARRVLLTQRAPTRPKNPTGLPQVILGPNEAEIADEVIAALAKSGAAIYERSGLLVRVVADDLGPRIEALPRASLRELIARHVMLMKEEVDAEGAPVSKRVNVPLWLADAVLHRGTWPGLRSLRGFVENAVLRPDGTVLAEPGYDPASGLLLLPSGTLPQVPERPTEADVALALALLRDVVCDFPFENAAHRAVWLSALLAGFARHAIAGPVPLHGFDGNLRGAGKSLLADIIAIIVTGRPMPRRAYTPDADETRKTVTSVAASGPVYSMFDNVSAPLAGAALDMVLTGEILEDRLFGRNDTTIRFRCTTLWLATGNNLVYGSDLIRRVATCRLKSLDETPETRTDFKHPNLIAYVREHRAQLAAAALTLLRVYILAGRPQKLLPAWGSYEAYSALVRQTLVFVGESDPAATRAELPDPARSLLERLLGGWRELYPNGEKITVVDILRDLSLAETREFATLRGALEELNEGPIFKDSPGYGRSVTANPNSIAKLLDAYRDRIVNGHGLQKLGKRNDGVHWRVVPAAEVALGTGDDGDGSDDSSSTPYVKPTISSTGNTHDAMATDPATVTTVSTVTSADEEFSA